jgi:hypothetical protein
MNGFILPELIIESLIRDGLQNVKADPTIIDDVFSQLTRAYAQQKYGQTEIDKINALVQKDLAVVFSYFEVDANAPCISIMIGSDTEDKRRAHLSDDYGQMEEQIVDPVELEALHRVNNLEVSSYDPTTGRVAVTDANDLSPVFKGMIFVDSTDVEHIITGGIDNSLGSKSFFIGKNEEVDFSDPTTCYIKSTLNYKLNEVRGLTGDETLVIGVHSKDSLTTKYLYILVKYFILSRKPDMIKRGMYLSSYSGSDFGRDSEYLGDQVKTRFLTITGKIDDTWRSDQVILIDSVEIDGTPID